MNITYEHPMNDLLRIALRLEHLFAALTHELGQSTIWSSRHALRYLIEILQVTDRPDLRTKMAQAIQMHIEAMTPLRDKNGVNQSALSRLLNELHEYADQLHQQHGKFGQACRTSHFLNPLTSRAHQGGVNDLTHPSYQLWLHQPAKLRKEQLTYWQQAFSGLHKMVHRLLQLTRDQAETTTQHAAGGFFHMALQPSRPIQMVRITIPSNTAVYPEISVGRHRLSVRMMTLQGDDKATQYLNDISFDLSCCAPFEKPYLSSASPEQSSDTVD